MEHGILARLSLTQRMHAAVARMVRASRADLTPAKLVGVLFDATDDLVQLLEPDGVAGGSIARVTIGPDGHQTATVRPRPVPIPQLVREQAEYIRWSRRAVSPLPFSPSHPTAHEAAADLAERVSRVVCQTAGTATLTTAFDRLEDAGRWAELAAPIRTLPGVDEDGVFRIADQLPGELYRIQREAATITAIVTAVAEDALDRLTEHEAADDGLRPRCGGRLRVAEDYSVVRWGERQFQFTVKQRAVVQRLVDAWEAGCGELNRTQLTDAAESDSNELRSLFRPNGRLHPAWNTLIICVVGRKGFYRLAIDRPS